MKPNSASYPTVAAADLYGVSYGLVARYGRALLCESRGEPIDIWGRFATRELELLGVAPHIRMRLIRAHTASGMISKAVAARMEKAS